MSTRRPYESERDACGIGFVADSHGRGSRALVEIAIDALCRVKHRGAVAADALSGDGAGLLLPLPDAILAADTGVAEERLGAAMIFADGSDPGPGRRVVEDACAAEDLEFVAWRIVPTDDSALGEKARASRPAIEQAIVLRPLGIDPEEGERRSFRARRRIQQRARSERVALYVASLSFRTITYKGLVAADRLASFYPDLADARYDAWFALFHQRFATNTTPTWERAQPFRFLAHNGEINTIRGNVAAMRSREGRLGSADLAAEDLLRPIVDIRGSDSAILDEALELLARGGRDVRHAASMLIPAAWRDVAGMDADVCAFLRYHACLIEPWDGPAGVVFTDGERVAAALDRNGLRPLRVSICEDGLVACSSESGAIQTRGHGRVRRLKIGPGQAFSVDPGEGGVADATQIKRRLARRRPYGEWLREHTTEASTGEPVEPSGEDLTARQVAAGFSKEEFTVVIRPMATEGVEPTSSMGDDTAQPPLAGHARPVFSFLKQRFAQVTNPAIDSVREHIVMSLRTGLGPESNLLGRGARPAMQLLLERPVLQNDEMAVLRELEWGGLKTRVLEMTFAIADGDGGMEAALDRLCGEASRAIREGASILVLSDRTVSESFAAIPSLLATSAVHQHLVRTGDRVHAGLAVETGEAREIHHVAALIGYGASAVNPYLMLDSVAALAERGDLPEIEPKVARERIVKALETGLLKVLSKMGISTISSYNAAQIFEAVGLEKGLVDKHFTGTSSSIGGVEITQLAHEAQQRHARAWPKAHGLSRARHVEQALLPAAHEEILPQGGVYAWRRDGERHMWDPETISALQRASTGNGDGTVHYSVFSRRVNEENAQHGLIRGLLNMTPLGPPVPLDEVEDIKTIAGRFSTGAMSLGALSPEAHETLAIAMNRIGGRSNSGEGGEDPRRYEHDSNGDWRRSAIKQVASGRFGVTAHYLANAEQIQIKISQGAKPGEGGQLPGYKVDEYIAQLRYSTPGVELISPPPHHDIYSIEDLKQLIYDLRTANPKATVSVKLASEVGVGTVAAGVVKAGADHVVIAGHDGGTGASPLSSIQSAGVPWEIGLAETQQTLLENDLRSRVILQTDGQMRTGRDVIVAALLGADEYGFSTAPLVVTGCIMMRVCHLNTCPVGVATQDPELRARFTGKPEHVVNYLFLVAEEVRQILARMGARSLSELVGNVSQLEAGPAISHWKAHGVDLSGLLAAVAEPGEATRHVPGDVPVREELDPLGLLDEAGEAIRAGRPIEAERDILNSHRAIGGVLSHEIVVAHGPAGLPAETVKLRLRGSAGQSLGAWLAAGISIDLRGEANDYVGKGLSGGVISVRPPEGATYVAEDNVIIGNVALYGATAGSAFFRGRAGERFAVRNSGTRTVVEGVGDHGCEYMTGGCVVVIGPTGYNFAAGMTGGSAFVHDPRGRFGGRCNRDLVDLDEMTEEDHAELRDLLVEHHARTRSAVAERILASFDETAEQFVKVMPREYKRVIEERRKLGSVEVTA